MKKSIIHIILFIALTALTALCLAYPFLSGNYDFLAIPISLVVQVFSIIGLITCVPAGLWLFKRNTDKQKKFVKIYVYTFFMAFLPVLLMTALTLSFSFGILLFVGLIISAKFVLRKIARQNTSFGVLLPFFLTFFPIILLAFPLVVQKPLTAWSRNKAIANCRELIVEIENFRTKYGEYPPTLNAVHKDYNVGIRGIEKYHYTYDNTTYNLYFEQPRFLLDIFGTREFVVYNPNGNYLMISHASWNARWEPEQIRATQGWYASGETEDKHWKYFLFD